MVRIVNKRFQQINLPSDIVDIKNGKVYHTLSGNDGYDLCNLLNELHEENKEFKEELLIYRKIASCSNCKYQNYDWFDDGDEFEICERGNNEQQIEYHICKDWRELE